MGVIMCYTDGLISWAQKVKEHNEFIYLFILIVKNSRKYVFEK